MKYFISRNSCEDDVASDVSESQSMTSSPSWKPPQEDARRKEAVTMARHEYISIKRNKKYTKIEKKWRKTGTLQTKISQNIENDL